jgi:oligopeptide transport system permease protein
MPQHASSIPPILRLLAYGILLAVFCFMGIALFRDATFIHPTQAGILPFTVADFPLGTDDLGRDLLARLSVGTQISMTVGIATALVASTFGSVYGLVAGMNEGALGDALMRGVDVLYSLPGLMVVVLLSVFLEPYLLHSLPVSLAPFAKLSSLVVALSFFSWPEAARLIRGQVLALKHQDFVSAFYTLGGGMRRLIGVHFLPNLIPYVMISIMVAVPRAILTESTLSFIGLGMEAPLSSWGTLAYEGWFLIRVKPYIMLEASLAIAVSMWAMNTVIRDLKHRWSLG